MTEQPVYVKASHKPVKTFFDSIGEASPPNKTFEALLAETSKRRGWSFTTHALIHVNGGTPIQVNGIFTGDFDLPRGYWVAKPAANKEKLDTAIKKHLKAHTPTTNTLFEDAHALILYQDGEEKLRANLSEKKEVVDLLNTFYSYATPPMATFEAAVTTFSETLPKRAQTIAANLKTAREKHSAFQTAYEMLYHVCKDALYDKLSREAVDEMILQHLFVERLIRVFFKRDDFTKKNAIAIEIERALAKAPAETLDREALATELAPFYAAIEGVASEFKTPEQLQKFLISLWERFMQGYAVHTSEAYTIETTPPALVDFMVSAVVQILKNELGLDLAEASVAILDPATGKGDVVMALLKRLPKDKAAEVYQKRIFANEILLLPYYLASLAIERAFEEIAGQKLPFKGLCFADTLDLKKRPQMTLGLFREENEDRISRQQDAPINVIVGNPLNYAGKLNDRNKRRRYRALKSDPLPGIDDRIDATYAKDSALDKHRVLHETYVRFIRWATDRLNGRKGVICLVTHNDFLEGKEFDGLRKHLATDFDLIYHVNLFGNIQLPDSDELPTVSSVLPDPPAEGFGLTVLVRTGQADKRFNYHALDFSLSADEKLAYLASVGGLAGIRWKTIQPTPTNAWPIIEPPLPAYEEFLPLGGDAKNAKSKAPHAIFATSTSGIDSKRDVIVYAANADTLHKQIEKFANAFNAEVKRYQEAGGKQAVPDLDAFVNADTVPWTDSLKQALTEGQTIEFDAEKVRRSLTKPFAERVLFFDPLLIEQSGEWASIFPTPDSETENRVLCVGGNAKMPLSVLMANCIVDGNLIPSDVTCFPFYMHDKNGQPIENITDWALEQFRTHYTNRLISKWDIFYYSYAMLHHPSYRERFEEKFAEALPRIPLVPQFNTVAAAGRALARLHLNPLAVEPHALAEKTSTGKSASYTVKKLRLNKAKTAITINPTLTLEGVPTDATAYAVGSRSVLEWFLDTYQPQPAIKKTAHADSDDEKSLAPAAPEMSIVTLLGKIVAMSVQTTTLAQKLPELK